MFLSLRHGDAVIQTNATTAASSACRASQRHPGTMFSAALSTHEVAVRAVPFEVRRTSSPFFPMLQLHPQALGGAAFAKRGGTIRQPGLGSEDSRVEGEKEGDN